MTDSVVLICLVICISLLVLAGLAAYTLWKIQSNKEAAMSYREEERTRRKEAELRNERYDMQLALGANADVPPQQEDNGLASLLTPENISLFMSLLSNRGGGSGSADGNSSTSVPNSPGSSGADSNPVVRQI